ncbi:hypothetical protein V6Z11_A10G154000 [Gossypium hirsutum]
MRFNALVESIHQLQLFVAPAKTPKHQRTVPHAHFPGKLSIGIHTSNGKQHLPGIRFEACSSVGSIQERAVADISNTCSIHHQATRCIKRHCIQVKQNSPFEVFSVAETSKGDTCIFNPHCAYVITIETKHLIFKGIHTI